MPIDQLFKLREGNDGPAAVAARIATTLERVRSHAVGLGGCGCATGGLSTVGFGEFQASLIHYVSATYPELDAQSAPTINELVDKALGCKELQKDKIEQALGTMLKALMSYAEQCSGFRSEDVGTWVT